MAKVLIDSSIWIDFIRLGLFKPVIRRLVEQQRLTICGVIKAEILPFLKSHEEKHRAYFQEMSSTTFEDPWWADAVAHQRAIVDQGCAPLTIPDLMILTTCLKGDYLLFTKDKMFSRVAGIVKLKLFDVESL